MAVSLRAFYHVTVSGEPGRASTAPARSSPSWCTLHSPEDLMVAVVAAPGAQARVGLDEVAAARAGPETSGRRRFAAGWSSATSVSWRSCSRTTSTAGRGSTRRRTPVTDQPHVVVVLDGGDGAAGLGVRRRPRACRA